MRTLNVRLLALILVCGLILGAAVHWLHGYQVQRNAKVFLREAQRAKEEGKLGDAVRNLRWYVDLVPNDVDALADLGSMLAKLSAPGPAYATFEKVLRLDPNRTDVRRELASVAIQLGRYRDAREHLEKHLLKDPPEDAELLFLFATCQEAMDDYKGAEESLKETLSLEGAIEDDPLKLGVYLRLANLLRRRLDRAAEADTWMAKMVTSNPDSCEAHVYRGSYLRATAKPNKDREGRLALAIEEAAKALKLAPDNQGALLLAAQCALEKKEFDKARDHARRAAELYPQSVAVYMTLADIEVQSGKRKEAIAWLRQGLQKIPGQQDLLWTRALLLADEGKTDEADEMLQQLRAAEYSRPLTDYLEARLEFLGGQWLAASRRFEQLRAELTAWPDLGKQANYWMGKCYQELGEPDRALTAFRQAAMVDPLWIPARAGIAAALVSLGRIEEAFQEYHSMVWLGSAPAEAHLQRARLAVLRNLTRNRQNRDWEEVEGLLDRAQQATPESVAISILRAEVLFAKDKLEETEQLLLDARDKKPEEVELWVALAALAQRQRDWDPAAKYLDDAEKQFGRSVPLRLARAQYYARRFRGEAKDKIKPLLDGDEEFSDADKTRLWAGLATVSLQIADYEQARRLYQRVCTKRPHHLATRLILFDLALRAEDTAGLEENLSQIHRITGDSPLWLYGRAVYLTLQALPLVKEKKDPGDLLDRALKSLAEARVKRPDWSRLPHLRARIHDTQGKRDLAVEEYRQAIELGARSPAAIRRVVQLLYAQRRYLEADGIIRRMEEQISPFSGEIGKVASEIALRLADFERAQQMAREAAADSKDYSDYIWLGQVLSILGLRARAEQPNEEADALLLEAEQELRRAIALAEKEPATWLALIQFFARTKETEKAEQAIEEAQSKIAPAEAPLAIAQCYEAIGRQEEAEKRYQEALAAAPNDAGIVRQVARFCLSTGKVDQGEALLRRITDGEIPAETGDIMWARRSLAMLLLARGGYDNLQRARKLVEENLKEDPFSLQDRRLGIGMGAVSPDPQERREAVKLMEDLLQAQQTTTPKERFVLAQLYLAAGDWRGFSRNMLRVLTSTRNEPEYRNYVATYLRALLARKEISEAELWLRRLEEIAPDQLLTAGLQAEVAIQRFLLFPDSDDPEKIAEKNALPGKAMGFLKGYAEKVDTESESASETRDVRLGLVAANLEQIGHRLKRSKENTAAEPFFTEAETMYRELVAEKPEREILLVPFLARQDRLDEALEVARRACKIAKPNVIAEALTVLLRESTASGKQLAEGEKILLEAITQHDRPVVLLMVLADLWSFRGKCDEAESLYREVLKKSDRNVLAMNNLAMLLAVRNKQLGDAKKHIDIAIKIAGPRPNLLDTRAMIYLAMNKPKGALDDLGEAMTQASGPTLYFHLAQVHYQFGKEKTAREALKEGNKRGLKPEILHPLEREAYRKLREKLK